MNTYVVTVKLPKNPNHDPHNKVIGPCPVTGNPCSDVTGEHHTFVVHHDSTDAIRVSFKNHYHITRIEQVS